MQEGNPDSDPRKSEFFEMNYKVNFSWVLRKAFSVQDGAFKHGSDSAGEERTEISPLFSQVIITRGQS